MKCELRFLVVVGKFTHCVQDGSNSFKLSNFLNYKGLVKKLYSAIALILNNRNVYNRNTRHKSTAQSNLFKTLNSTFGFSKHVH